MKPHIHAESSARKFGGKPDDYIAIHDFIDCSKGVIADHRHRALTHNTWFIMTVLPRVFGDTIKNSKGKKVSVRDIGEQHVLEDFRGKFIPSAQDFLQAMEYQDWMNNGEAYPPSHPQGRVREDNRERIEQEVQGAMQSAMEKARKKIMEEVERMPIDQPPYPPPWPHYPYPPSLPQKPLITD